MTSSDAQPAGDTRYQNGWIGWVQIGVIITVTVIAALITLWLSTSSEGPASEAAGSTDIPVRVLIPQTSTHTPAITITGTVTASAQVDIAPQVGGRVVNLSEAARAGARFQAGGVLFEIDPRDYRVAVTRAEAALADADASLQQIEANAQIARREWEAEYPNREITPLAAREPQLAAARARRLAAEADLAQAELNLERTRLSFPFEGRVSESRLEAGLLVNAGQRYGSVYDIASLEIVAPIAPSDLERLGAIEDARVRVTLEGASDSFEARVARIGALLDARTRFVDLFLDPGDATRRLRPGEFAQIRLEAPPLENVFVLPAIAAPSVNAVRVVENGAIVERQITVLDRPRGQVVVEPFDFGEGIIISPVPEGTLGQPANILDDEAAPRRSQ
jgi:RND family efflux transporter MFP subunit